MDDGDRIGALASYTVLPGGGGNPGIIVAAEVRGRGHGRRALVAITRRILSDGYLPVLQTLASNQAMQRCALAIGYTTHAVHVAVRLAH